MKYAKSCYLAFVLVFFAAPVFFVAPVLAQPDLAEHQEAIAALSFMVGTWEGEGEIRRGPETEGSRVFEKVETRLDGTVLYLEGLGTRELENGEVETTHQAIGLIWYDSGLDQYRMKAFTPARETDADVEITENQLVWSFAAPRGRARYTATFTEDTWVEIGEFSADGENWVQFFSMNLTRVSDSE